MLIIKCQQTGVDEMNMTSENMGSTVHLTPSSDHFCLNLCVVKS